MLKATWTTFFRTKDATRPDALNLQSSPSETRQEHPSGFQTVTVTKRKCTQTQTLCTEPHRGKSGCFSKSCRATLLEQSSINHISFQEGRILPQLLQKSRDSSARYNCPRHLQKLRVILPAELGSALHWSHSTFSCCAPWIQGYFWSLKSTNVEYEHSASPSMLKRSLETSLFDKAYKRPTCTKSYLCCYSIKRCFITVVNDWNCCLCFMNSLAQTYVLYMLTALA